MKKMMKKIIYLVVVLLVLASVNAEIKVTKKLSDTDIACGDVVTVTILLENNQGMGIKGVLIENYPAYARPEGDFISGGVIGVLKKNITLQPSSEVKYSYNLTFNDIPVPVREKEHLFPATVLLLDNSSRYSSNELKIFISEPTTGPCNYDFVCDPGENRGNCFQDCPSGGKDDYCDGLDDLLCDPDCEVGEDVDCKDKCGDGVCSEVESYLSCRLDCPAGGRDGFCDYIDDGVCDPDCATGEDPDCTTESSTTTATPTTEPAGGEDEDFDGNLLIYLAIAAVLLVVGFAAYSRYKKRKQIEETQNKREKLIEWIEKELRNGEDPEKLKPVVRSQGFEEELVDYVIKKLT